MNITVLPKEFSGDPEAVAMLQAFYSRSIEPINSRIERMGGKTEKVKEALKRVYLGYGHNSVADGGSVTLFIENVSILAAKALQEHPLYNGQECSSRFLELSGEGYPSGGSSAKEWAALQKEILEKLIVGVRATHPFDANEDDAKAMATWRNATAARAFDIARGWIPASALTNLSVHMTIRQLNDMTARLSAHPLFEVVEIAHEMKRVLAERYTDACSPAYTAYDNDYIYWLRNGGSAVWYNTDSKWFAGDMVLNATGSLTIAVSEFLSKRPKYAAIPTHIQNYITFTMEGIMDYGTWRDLQRHRRNLGAPPMLTAHNGFNKWYIDALHDYLSEDDATRFSNSTVRLITKFKNIGTEPVLDQYRLPIGMNVVFSYTFGLAQAVYLAELRSGNTVHPILRPFAQELARELEIMHGVKVHYDREPARFDLKRGTQTITENAT